MILNFNFSNNFVFPTFLTALTLFKEDYMISNPIIGRDVIIIGFTSNLRGKFSVGKKDEAPEKITPTHPLKITTNTNPTTSYKFIFSTKMFFLLTFRGQMSYLSITEFFL